MSTDVYNFLYYVGGLLTGFWVRSTLGPCGFTHRWIYTIDTNGVGRETHKRQCRDCPKRQWLREFYPYADDSIRCTEWVDDVTLTHV
jgi:hypothetical protein